jgi:hypothetical protein
MLLNAIFNKIVPLSHADSQLFDIYFVARICMHVFTYICIGLKKHVLC